MSSTAPAPATPPARADRLKTLGETAFDLLVVGGGITGAGIARDAQLRGLKVALCDQGDFACGTSSRSSRLVHGGLRYLEHGQLGLVHESTVERGLLARLAPHLVRPLAFLVPAYRGQRPGLLTLKAGLSLYDALSLYTSPRLHRAHGRRRTLALEPGLLPDDLRGSIVYYDCITDDARLTLENILDAAALGATTVNYARLVGLSRRDGRVCGAMVRDLLGKRELEVQARVVVSATGPWTDELFAAAGVARPSPLLRPTKGVHVVVDAARLPARHALVMNAVADRRVMFAIPWGRRTIIGTTDTDYRGRPDEVFADAADVAYLLETANRYYPQARLTPDDVLATWAGLRPLIAPDSGVAAASDVSREHEVLVGDDGLITIAGGKLTTYRRMAAEVVGRVLWLLRDPAGLSPCMTKLRPLPGACTEDPRWLERLPAELFAKHALDSETAAHLSGRYGVRAKEVVRRMADDTSLAARIDPELPFTYAEVAQAVAGEMAETLEDVLWRRLPLLLLGRDQGLAATEKVARVAAAAGGWDDARRQSETDRYRSLVAATRRFREVSA